MIDLETDSWRKVDKFWMLVSLHILLSWENKACLKQVDLINGEIDKKTLINSEILERIREGDEAAFAVFYRYYSPMLGPIHWRCVEAGVDPAEVMQLTFLKAWLHRDRLNKIEQLKAWLSRIAYREYLMAIRKKLVYESKLGEYVCQTNEYSNPPVTPDQNSSYIELTRCIQKIVNSLSPQRRLFYSLNRNEGLSVSEIAERLGFSVSTVKNTLQAAQKQIREALTEAGYGPYALLYIFFAVVSTLPFEPHLYVV